MPPLLLSYRYFGIRILSFATGLGKKASLSVIILQISSAIALLGVAQTVTDFFLEYVVAERKHYLKEKIQDIDIRSKED